MAIDGHLESMPTELKIAFLKQLPDINTLSALVHASPVFHAVYLAIREDILTKTTLRELSTKNQFLHIGDLLKPASLCHFVTGTGELDPSLEFAIRASQAQANKITDIRLTVDSCIALRTLRFYYGWELEIGRKNEITYEEWPDPLRDCFVHTLVFGDYEPPEVCLFRYRVSGVGNGPGAWFAAVSSSYPNRPAATRVGRVWIFRSGASCTIQEHMLDGTADPHGHDWLVSALRSHD